MTALWKSWAPVCGTRHKRKFPSRHPRLQPHRKIACEALSRKGKAPRPYLHRRVWQHSRILDHWDQGMHQQHPPQCVVCNKLCGRTAEQKMADLPSDCLNTEPPFTSVGLDVFGPWAVTTRWFFTGRFFALRGPAKQIHSDCGANFTGACKELHMLLTDSKEPNVRKYLGEEGCSWMFNHPNSSHMVGACEWMIGISRHILNSMLKQTSPSHLTHEVLSTLMAEVTAIVNARPLAPISSNTESPFLFTPTSLLTQK